jgi:ribonuclease R
VSGTHSRGRTGSGPPRSAPAPAGAVVAVLQRSGRFLTAEPLFPPAKRADRGPSRGRGSARIVLKSAGSGRGGATRAAAGDLVLVQGPARGSGARIVRVLGRPDVARDVIEGLMLDRGLSRGFDPAVEREARQARDRGLDVAAREVAAGQRRDLRELATFTIDPVSARDFDDAISAQRLDDGGTRVWVHIADVAAHVPEGSLVDREARRRATSVYVPGAVEPMLPHALSSDACSLKPGVERAAVTIELELRDAVVTRAAFYRSLIRSDVRLDYERVDRIFAGRESAAEPWGEPLAAARDAAAALQRKREHSGALVIDSEEPDFTFDDQGNVSEIQGRVQTESHRLIEHLMIAANEAVAALLSQRGVPCLYRVHERPQPESIERLCDQLATLEVSTPPLGDHMSPSQATEILGAVSQLVNDHVRRTGQGRIALHSLVLRSLKQAYYSPKNLGHAGLRSASYCHFTSPIRRYPDLVCHRALLSAVGADERAPRAGELSELGTWTSEREREAITIERDSDDIASCFALERVLREGVGFEQVFAGEIRGLISAGAFIAFGLPPVPWEGVVAKISIPFEGMLPVRHMSSGPQGREWWEINQQGTILHGERSGATLRLGDAIEVRVARVDTIRGRVDLLPIEDRPAG